MSSPIPRRVRDAAVFFLGDEGADAWVRNAEATQVELLQRWELVPGEPFTGGVLSLCLPCSDCQGRTVVLKLPIEPETGRLEADALECLADTRAAPLVLGRDERSGALLMSYVAAPRPYEPRGTRHDVAEFEALLQLLRGGLSDGLPPLNRNIQMRTRWAIDRFRLPANRQGRVFLSTAESFVNPLLASSPSEFVHGDLQAKNILATPASLVAIDPFACFGDPLFDAAFWAVMLPGPEPIESV